MSELAKPYSREAIEAARELACPGTGSEQVNERLRWLATLDARDALLQQAHEFIVETCHDVHEHLPIAGDVECGCKSVLAKIEAALAEGGAAMSKGFRHVEWRPREGDVVRHESGAIRTVDEPRPKISKGAMRLDAAIDGLMLWNTWEFRLVKRGARR